MKTRIALGATLLLALGTSGAGSVLYDRGEAIAPEASPSTEMQVTPEMIEHWKATAASADYIAPKVPI